MVADLKHVADRLIAAHDGATMLPPITTAAPESNCSDETLTAFL